MSGHLIIAIQRYFKDNHLNATDEWLEECVEWAIGNQPPHEQTLVKLQDFAYQQWLLADLREIGMGCLPANILDQRLTILTGNYTVQAEKFLDIANPMYSQLKLLRGGNIEVEEPENPERDDETDHELSEWGKGPKKVVAKLKTRKLKLTLSDGKVEVTALEYRPLQQLKGMVYPGVKLLIVGPVECRRGMLLLENKHVKLLGGEVDTLMTSNAPENLMAKALGLPENADPYVGLQSTVGEAGCITQPVQIAAIAPRGRQPNTNHVTPLMRPQASQVAPRMRAQAPNNLQVAPVKRAQHVAQRECFEDDFDLTEEDLLALEMSEQLQTSRVQHNQAPQTSARPAKQQLNTSETKTQPIHMEEDYIEMDLDDLESQITASHFNQNLSSRKSNNDTSAHKPPSVPQSRNVSRDFEDPRLLTDKAKITLNARKPVETFTKNNLRDGKPASTSKQHDANPSWKRTSAHAQNFDDLDDQVDQEMKQKDSNQPPPKKIKGFQSDIRSFATSESSSKPNLARFLSQQTSKPTRRLAKKVATSPFVYLIQLRDPHSRPKHAVVKACVVTLLQKLKPSDGHWNLKLKIADGSTSLDVQFTNEVLEHLIGFSVAQFINFKLGSKENPIMKEKLDEFGDALQELKKTLIDLICLMHLDFTSPGLPNVTKLEPITLQHAHVFKLRC